MVLCRTTAFAGPGDDLCADNQRVHQGPCILFLKCYI